MSASDALQSIRAGGYPGGKTPAAPTTDERVLPLTDEEMQSVQTEPGKEICLAVYGTMDKDGAFHVTRIEPQAADENNITPEDVMGGPPNRAMPSPS